MARAGHLVVSGGALGTDAAAHWGAVKAMDEMSAALAGRTVAVFAGGLNHIGPKSNQDLFEQIESLGRFDFRTVPREPCRRQDGSCCATV